ncbi:lycopene cyclase domain-containing protein [Arthrobacter ginkgonis]|uniref:Lycopene cyclase domain-containing protein n=1 Tax=Arthrobacter ginkgonis TaxID=1630594 RepID=A0ABP7C141_9MICC
MSYLELNAVFLGIAAAAVLAVPVVLRPDRRSLRHAGAAMAATLAVLLVLTAVFDNAMIAAGLFDYSGHALAGARVGLAPLEDFAYPLGAALLLPALWMLLTVRGKGRD